MPSGLKRYQQAHHLHFITFTCFHRAVFLQTASARDVCVQTLERVRVWYGFYVVGGWPTQARFWLEWGSSEP